MSDTMGRSGGGRSNRELVLPPGTFAFILDMTKGKVSVYVGPIKTSLADTDQPVVWNDQSQTYEEVEEPTVYTQTWALASEGQYIVLTNPAPASAQPHPSKGVSTESADLDTGRRVVVSGPATFPLWPGQTAITIPGHHLRHNQYVLVQVVDPESAQANWASAVVAPQIPTTPAVSTSESTVGEQHDEGQPAPDADAGEQSNAESDDAPVEEPSLGLPVLASDLTMGQLMIIPGTRVSFYMPSTGLQVVPDGSSYVRDAVTLETLQYCILLDENGKKRYVRGPEVVFPKPTEKFKLNAQGDRVFNAIELNAQSGLHIKVIQDYEEQGQTHQVGEEIFLRGSEQSIYFPRPEHSIITYDDKQKHHAIAIPAGEGRYVLNRDTGEVTLVQGPNMFLPDPRHQVIVRRILSVPDVQLMYPGNNEALQVNQGYRAEADKLEDGEPLRSREASLGGDSARDRLTFRGASTDQEFGGDTMDRGTAYTPPRTITLVTKDEGAVAISIWPGYAVLVTNKTGERRVEVGPKVVLLDYDETIMSLKLSTGRPKSDLNLLRTGYLRVVNNVVSDQVTVETKDLVSIKVELSYRVNFEGDTPGEQLKWFDVENYVQILTDHCRSRLRRAAKNHGITDFYANAIDIIRDTLLGAPAVEEGTSRIGLKFQENGMRVNDVEILAVAIDDESVARLLENAQSKTLEGVVSLSIAEGQAERDERMQELQRDAIEDQQLTAAAKAGATLENIAFGLEEALAKAQAELAEAEASSLISLIELETDLQSRQQDLLVEEQRDELAARRQAAETAQINDRMRALSPAMVQAIVSLSDTQLVETITKAVGPAALAAGLTPMDMLADIFKGTPLEELVSSLARRPMADRIKNGLTDTTGSSVDD